VHDASDIAAVASKKAEAGGNRQGHLAAQDAHHRAANECLANGDTAKAKKHEKAALAHGEAAERLKPSDGGNPLLSWIGKPHA